MWHMLKSFHILTCICDVIVPGQATDPTNEEDRWDCIQGFYQLVNQDADG